MTLLVEAQRKRNVFKYDLIFKIIIIYLHLTQRVQSHSTASTCTIRNTGQFTPHAAIPVYLTTPASYNNVCVLLYLQCVLLHIC